MARKPVTLAAFEVAPTQLRFVEMTRDDRRVLAAAAIDLDEGRWLDRDHLTAQARALFTGSVRGKPARLIASVPACHAHFRLIDAPAEGARDYLEWDMTRYLARPREDYAFAFVPVNPLSADPTPEGGARRHVATAFDRAQAARVRDAISDATRQRLDALDIDAVAIANALSSAHPESRAARAIVVQVERYAASALRLQGGVLSGFALARKAGIASAVLRPGADPQERAESLMTSAHAIRDALRQASADWETPERAFLCGELAASEDFRELLRAQTGITFRLLNPFANMPGPDPADFPGAWPGAPFTTAVGLALRLAEEN